jgi:hypothetical protein
MIETAPELRRQMREWAFVLADEKIGSARDTMRYAPLTARQWVNIFECAANAANCATDALEMLFGYQPSSAESNKEVVIKMTARLLDELDQDVDDIGGVDALRYLGRIISTRNKSMHKASVILDVGNEYEATRALEATERFVRWIQWGLVAVANVDPPEALA